MSDTINRVEHDIGKLDDLVDDLLSGIRGVSVEDRLVELKKLWRQPGFTTPAEFLLLRFTLEEAVQNVRQLQRGIDTAVEGVNQILR